MPSRNASQESLETILSHESPNGDASEDEEEDFNVLQAIKSGSVNDLVQSETVQNKTKPSTARKKRRFSALFDFFSPASGVAASQRTTSGEPEDNAAACNDEDAAKESAASFELEDDDDMDIVYEDEDEGEGEGDEQGSAVVEMSEAAICAAHELGVTHEWINRMREEGRLWLGPGKLEANLSKACADLPHGYRGAFYALSSNISWIWIEVNMRDTSNLTKVQLKGLQALCETEAEKSNAKHVVVRVLFKANYSLTWENVQCFGLVREFPNVGLGIFESAFPPDLKRDILQSSMNWIIQDRLRQKQYASKHEREEDRKQAARKQSSPQFASLNTRVGSFMSTWLHTGGEDSKGRDKSTHGLVELSDLGNLVRSTIVGIVGRCMLCSSSLPLTMFRPAVCDADQCIFQAEELKLGVSVEHELVENWKVVDFLLVLLSMALTDIHETSITLCAPKGTGIPDQKRIVERLVRRMPPMTVLWEHAQSGTLRSFLDKIDCQLYSLLGWIIGGGCRSFLRCLEPDEEIPGLSTICQFQVLSPAEKEARFRHLQRKHGTFLAFHGSPAGNWHSIVRLGLKNFSSHSKYRRHGASYGNGIYLAEQTSTTSSYIKSGNVNWSGSKLLPNVHSGQFLCQAVCEVVNNTGAFAYSSSLRDNKPCVTAEPDASWEAKDGIPDPALEAVAGMGDSGNVCSSSSFSLRRRPNGNGIHVVPFEDYVRTSVILIHNEHPHNVSVHDLKLPPALFPAAAAVTQSRSSR
ncbi:Poly ADP-ribose polymerase 6 [Hondaea fermentalgiana]|uniref:Poly ADP-ribose polymerase 6 n=1 Tax=Hondaea fermentalgiana TaxID=2315210 RepID=A0A2R5GGT0_9STRA|nr:Poly ADP-ribose polymerase 6 [Hondaea fermentalgiana]|eukprot:GBG27863.1 Poly ADP-ribose polymerase 6 [Hondaea fermentalgiana]